MSVVCPDILEEKEVHMAIFGCICIITEIEENTKDRENQISALDCRDYNSKIQKVAICSNLKISKLFLTNM